MRRLLAVLLLTAAGCSPSGPVASPDDFAERDSTTAGGLATPAGARDGRGTIAFEDSVHALVVFVRFSDDATESPEWPVAGPPGREAVPDWGLALVREDPAEVPRLSVWDPSLSAYFYHQSRGGPSGPLILTGEVWPRAGGRPHVYRPRGPSEAYRGGRGSGYGYLVREVLDALVTRPGFDLGRFDANRDGELDHLALVVRSDPGAPLVGGVASLAGVTNARVQTGGTPGPLLRYPSARGEVVVDMGPLGSGTVNWVGGQRSVRTVIHELGHVLFDMGHTAMIGPTGRGVTNDVPADVPEGKGSLACTYNRMCGGGASGGRPSESSNYDETLTLSGHELRRMGWARRVVLDRDTADVRLRPLYGSGDVALVGLRDGSGGDTLSLESRHRTNAFDAFPPFETGSRDYGRIYRDLPTEGLLVTVTHGDPTGPAGRYRYDFQPPSNRYVPGGSRCGGALPGCAGDVYAPWRGDLYKPSVATQLTPWTRPNTSGFSLYPPDSEPNWFAVQRIRYTGRGAEMAFDFVADVREQPEVVVTKDSWMGAETDGHRFRQPVRVRGATLRVWEGATVAFDGGLSVAAGGAFVCESGARCTVGGRPVRSL